MQEERDTENSPPSSVLNPILVVGGALAGLMLLVCGGVAGYVAIKTPARVEGNADNAQTQPNDPPSMMKELYEKNRSAKALPLTHDAEVVTKIAATIFKIDLPEGFSPRDAEGQSSFTRAVFSNQNENSALLKMARTGWMRAEQEGLSSADDLQVSNTLKIVEPDYGSRSETTLKATRQELKNFQRELTVLGQKTNFTFKQGKRAVDNKHVWKVWGGFATTNGVAAMILLVPESEFDEEAVVRMIEGIRQADKASDIDDLTTPEASRPEASQPDASPPGQAEPAKPDAAKPDRANDGSAKPD